MVNPMNRTEKKKRNFDDRKNMKKNMGQTAQFFHQPLMVRGGSNVWAFRDQAFASAALFDLGFGVWILDFGFVFLRFGMWWESHGRHRNKTDRKKRKTYRINK